MRTIGRLLQITGLVILPASIVMQLLDAISVRELYTVLIFGAAAFYLGRYIEGYSQGSK